MTAASSADPWVSCMKNDLLVVLQLQVDDLGVSEQEGGDDKLSDGKIHFHCPVEIDGWDWKLEESNIRHYVQIQVAS